MEELLIGILSFVLTAIVIVGFLGLLILTYIRLFRALKNELKRR